MKYPVWFTRLFHVCPCCHKGVQSVTVGEHWLCKKHTERIKEMYRTMDKLRDVPYDPWLWEHFVWYGNYKNKSRKV